MAAPLIWLTFYLSAGALLLWACYNSSFCLVSTRVERNRRITGIFSASDQTAPPATSERVPTPR